MVNSRGENVVVFDDSKIPKQPSKPRLDKYIQSKLSLFKKISVLNLILLVGLIAGLCFAFVVALKFRDKFNDLRNSNKDLLEQVQILSNKSTMEEKRASSIKDLEFIIKEETKSFKSGKKLNPVQINSYATMMVDQSELYKFFDPIQLASLCRQESEFDSRAFSDSAAKGLFQFMPGTAGDASRALGWQYYDGIEYVPEKSIAMGAWYLASRCAMYKGDYDLALAYFNGGNANANSYKYYRMGEQGATLDSVQTAIAGKLWSETRKFVPSVKAHEKRFREMIRNRDLNKVMITKN